jgi:transposase
MSESAERLSVSPAQRRKLQGLAGSRATPPKVALRAKIVLLAARGAPNNAIATELETSRPTVLLWRERFSHLGVPGILQEAKRSGRKRTVTDRLIQRIVRKTQRGRPGGQGQWSTRSLAREMGVSHDTIYRIWKQHGLAPHLDRRRKSPARTGGGGRGSRR